MKRKLFYNILIIMALLASCKKVELEPVDGEPVFTTEAQFNGSPKSWMAGVDDYYMFSSFEKDVFDVYTFTGSFAINDSCCAESLTFHLRDFRQAPQGIPNFSESFSLEFEYADLSGNDTIIVNNTDSVWNAYFTAYSFIQPDLPVQYNWDFGDQTTDSTTETSISHTYENLPNGRPVTLLINALNGSCSGYFTRNISFGQTNQNCNIAIDIDSITNTEFLVIITPNGVAPFNYLWSDSSTSSTTIIPISPSAPANISVTVTDATGCTVSAGLTTTMNPGAIPPICVASFDYDISQDTSHTISYEIEYADSLRFSTISVVYTNLDGLEFRSDRKKQDANARIRILDVEDYEDNEKGQKTKKLTLVYACRLWASSGQFIDVTAGKAVIAVALP